MSCFFLVIVIYLGIAVSSSMILTQADAIDRHLERAREREKEIESNRDKYRNREKDSKKLVHVLHLFVCLLELLCLLDLMSQTILYLYILFGGGWEKSRNVLENF